MSAATYVRCELLRALRNRRFFFFSIGFPLALYLLIAGPNRGETDLGGSGIPAPLYFMVGLASFGTMNAVTAAGGRIAAERALNWTRQLRVTPLSPRVYFATKLTVAYSTALMTIAVLYAAGLSLGVHESAGRWIEMTALILIGLLPFAALGIMLGHVLNVDALGPTIGGTTALLGFLGGVWFPLGDGFLGDVAQALPSYWLVQAGRVGVGAPGWGVTGWAVVTAWTAALTALAVRAYIRDTQRA
jgi:ABC-2 type transport system permease protein